MSSAYDSRPGQKVPAWKRLGLQLKPAAPTEPGAAPAAGSQPNGPRKQDLGVNASSAAKRKRPDVSAPAASASPLKKTRLNDKDAVARTPTLRKQKSVTFTDDTKNPADANTANGVKTPAKKATPAANKSSKPSKQQPTADPKPALDYLQTWKHARASWKFNKNYQTLLIKRAFDPHALPTDHIEIFYEYIRDLKGGLRLRLRDTARELRNQDAAEGKGGFPEGTMDVQAKQAEYDAIITGILQLGLGAGTKRKRFDEVTFMQAPPEPILAHRVIKRMRAELIDGELSDSDDEKSEDDSGSEALTTTTEATTVAAAEEAIEEEAAPKPAQARLDDKARAAPVAGADAKRVRRRKLRVAAEDTSSDESSDSDSDSDSGSSDSESSDSESDDDEGAAGNGANNDDSSDSSDSSSSGSDDESGDEAEDSDSDDSSDSSDSDSDSDSEDEQPAKAVATQPKKKSAAARA